MILNLFKVEMRKHFPIFGVFTLIQIILSIAVLRNYDYINIYFQISTISWIILPIYIFIDLYNEFYKGKEVITHMIPLKTSTKFLVKSVIFSLGLMIMWSTCLIFELFNLNGIYYSRIIDSDNPTMGITYFILARFIGCISGPIIIGLAIALSKLVRNNILSIAVIVITIIGITMGLYLIMKSNVINEGKIYFSIGTTSQKAFKQYAGLVSVLVQSDKDVVDIVKTVYWNNIIFNILVSVLGYGIMSLILNSKRYEVLGK